MYSFNFRMMALFLAVAVMLVSLPPLPAMAGMVSTDTVIAEQTGATADAPRIDRNALLAAMARDDMRAGIAALGVDPAEAEARIAALSDVEFAELANQIDNLPAGADHGYGTDSDYECNYGCRIADFTINVLIGVALIALILLVIA